MPCINSIIYCSKLTYYYRKQLAIIETFDHGFPTNLQPSTNWTRKSYDIFFFLNFLLSLNFETTSKHNKTQHLNTQHTSISSACTQIPKLHTLNPRPVEKVANDANTSFAIIFVPNNKYSQKQRSVKRETVQPTRYKKLYLYINT